MQREQAKGLLLPENKPEEHLEEEWVQDAPVFNKHKCLNSHFLAVLKGKERKKQQTQQSCIC